jgi:hypothetical protein
MTFVLTFVLIGLEIRESGAELHQSPWARISRSVASQRGLKWFRKHIPDVSMAYTDSF